MTNSLLVKMTALSFLTFDSSIGPVTISWNDRDKLTSISIGARACSPDSQAGCLARPISQAFLDLIFRFREYLDSGKPFVSNGESDWALIDHESLTDFQRAVYKATLAIPHGETRTYGWIAQRIGRPLAARAVGQALRNNPLLIIVPCHRVVATTALGGFMGVSNPEEPEMRLKSRLIQIEGDYVNPLFPFLAGLTGGNEWARATA